MVLTVSAVLQFNFDKKMPELKKPELKKPELKLPELKKPEFKKPEQTSVSGNFSFYCSDLSSSRYTACLTIAMPRSLLYAKLFHRQSSGRHFVSFAAV